MPRGRSGLASATSCHDAKSRHRWRMHAPAKGPRRWRNRHGFPGDIASHVSNLHLACLDTYGAIRSLWAHRPPHAWRAEDTSSLLPHDRDRGDLALSLQRFSDVSVSYTHLRAHETDSYLVCRL